MKNTSKNVTIIKAKSFDFTQMLNKKINVKLSAIENVANEDKTIINYRIYLTLENVPTAEIRYLIYNIDRDGYATSLRKVTALQLTALNLLKNEFINGYDTGRVLFDITAAKDAIGREYTAQLHLIDSVIDGKQIKWKFLLPDCADTAILEQIAQVQNASRLSDDIMDNTDTLVSFDSSRDNDYNDIIE